MSAEKTWCGGMNYTTGPGDVCQCAEPCPLVMGTECMQFDVKVGVHQGSVLSPLHFTIVLEAI